MFRHKKKRSVHLEGRFHNSSMICVGSVVSASNDWAFALQQKKKMIGLSHDDKKPICGGYLNVKRQLGCSFPLNRSGPNCISGVND